MRTVHRQVVKASDEESLELKKIRSYPVLSIFKGKYSIINTLVSSKTILKVFMFIYIRTGENEKKKWTRQNLRYPNGVKGISHPDPE